METDTCSNSQWAW